MLLGAVAIAVADAFAFAVTVAFAIAVAVAFAIAVPLTTVSDSAVISASNPKSQFLLAGSLVKFAGLRLQSPHCVVSLSVRLAVIVLSQVDRQALRSAR